jgi:acetyl esterase/lipase
MKKLYFFFLSFLFISSYSQQYSNKWTDLNYADDGKSYHLLDIYLPTITREFYPVIVYIYGSAWYSNNLKGSDMNTIGSALLDAGYAVVTPNHRSSGDTLYPGQIHDIKAVIRFLRANSEKYKLDTSFIGISGSSSGGHLAALTGTSGYVNAYTVDSITMDIEGNLGNCKMFSSKVDAVCDWFGPTDLLVIDSCRGSSFGAPGQSPEEVLIGEKKTDNKSKFILANPITFIDPTDPPFLIFHGDADVVVPYCESVFLNNALKSAGVQSEYVQVSGGQHYTGTHTEANYSLMVDFFNNISKNDITSSVHKFNQNDVTVSINTINSKLKIHGIDGTELLTYDIMDISGRIITKNYFLSDEIDISSIKDGLYILKLSLKNKGEISKKFIKS